MTFYRYEIVEYASMSEDYNRPTFPNPSLVLYEFNLFKETLKGYWIGTGSLGNNKLRSEARWVSKTSKKRYAYPSKEEALTNFIKRNEYRVSILKRQALSCSIGIGKAKDELNKILQYENQ